MFLLPSVLLADEVFLKGAGTISGRIVEQTADTIRVDVGSGTIGVKMSHVDRIVKARSPLDDYDDRAKKLGPKDAEGWKALGRWALKQGLPAQSRDAYKKVLTIAPDDREANGALGLVLLNGRWVTKDESYRAQGYVKYQGEWMTPDQAQINQASDAANQARRNAEQRASDAEAAAVAAEARAREAEQQALEAQNSQDNSAPSYWGGWGYGPTYWPSTTTPNRGAVNRPAQLPAGRRR